MMSSAADMCDATVAPAFSDPPAPSPKPTVGFIGLGMMGGPMASRLQRAGYALVVHDNRRMAADPHLSAGAVWADTPRAVAELSGVVITCLPGVSHIDAVALGANGILDGTQADQVFFEMSTSSPEQISRLHKAFAERGAHMLDAPVSGGPRGAQRGRLAIWVGGDATVYRRHEAVLRAMGDSPSYIGPVGSGLVTKLVHNCASQATQAAMVEAFVLGVKAGADPVQLWKAVRQGAIGRRRTFDGLADEFLSGKYEGLDASLRIVYKDLKSATGLARELGVPMRIANMALADLEEAMNRGWSEHDCRTVMLLPQERAGVAIRADPDDIAQALQQDPPA